MQVTKKQLNDNKIELILTADEALLATAKKQALDKLAAELKLPGFRKGKVPANLVEKNADQKALQAEFLDLAMNALYVNAVNEQDLRPVGRPVVKVNKFVPYSALEMNVTIEVVGEVKLPDYKKIKLPMPEVKVTDQDVNQIIERLQEREAESKAVKRAAKKGDEVVIDFKGVDAKNDEPIQGAEAQEFKLILGSDTFIPGFEDQLVGLKAGEEKTFPISFPKEYSVKSLQGKPAKFTVTIKSVNELTKPGLNDAFAKKVGNLPDMKTLKSEIKKQVENERHTQALQNYDNELLAKITEQSIVSLPESLTEQQIDQLEQAQRQNVIYRGQTWEEFLKSEGKDEKAYRDTLRAQAEQRVKAGLVLAEISEKEDVRVMPDELAERIESYKQQYKNDEQMQAELAKTETQREIASRIATEKTITLLRSFALSNDKSKTPAKKAAAKTPSSKKKSK